MKAPNPDLVLFAYMIGMFARPGHHDAFPLGWYLRDAPGVKVRSRR